MKKEIRIVVSIVLAVWFFFMGFEIGSYKERKAQSTSVNVPQTNIAEQTTVAPITQTPQTTVAPVVTTEAATSDIASQTTNDSQSNETTADNSTVTKVPANNDPSSLSKEEILKNVTDAINAVKSEQNMTAVRTETITINLTDLSLASLKNTVNNIIQGLAGEEKFTYNFQNGQATGVDDNGKEDEDGVQSPNSAIPPKNAQFALPADGVVAATAQKDGANTVYTLKLVEESTTYTAPVPQYNSLAFSYLDLTSIDIPIATITDASMHYPGTEITATVNEAGKLIGLHYVMPMDGYGEASIRIASGNATFEGSDDEAWTFSY
ncbi:MAG: hypothetical protein NC110_01015 [Ruminococcus sp.]|nr:hypothetical protein [Ruminococcus sp.]